MASAFGRAIPANELHFNTDVLAVVIKLPASELPT
jgi:hypothetical protein